MTNIITAVMLNYFSTPRIMFLISIKKWVLIFDHFAGLHLLQMMIPDFAMEEVTSKSTIAAYELSFLS